MAWRALRPRRNACAGPPPRRALPSRLSARVNAAMMTRRWSPISPNVLRISPIFSSIVPASNSSRASSPSLQARRYLRPSMVTETCDIARAFSKRRTGLNLRVRRRPAENAFDRLSGVGEPLGCFGVGGFERARPVDGRVELDRKPRAIVLHQREFLLRGCARFVVAHAHVGRPLERVDRGGETFERDLKRIHGGVDSIHCGVLFTRCLNGTSTRARAAIDRFLRPPLIGAPVPLGVKSPPELGTSELPAPIS